MVVHWRKELARDVPAAADGAAAPGTGSRLHTWLRLACNALGTVATAVALTIILSTKLVEGAWISLLAIGGLLLLFKLIERQYRKLARQLAAYCPHLLAHDGAPVVLLPFRCWDKPTEKSLRFALWLSSDIFAVHILNVDGAGDESEEPKVRRIWRDNVEVPVRNAGGAVPQLVVRSSKYRDFAGPMLAEIDRIHAEFPDRPITVIIPEVVSRHWWEKLLHANHAGQLPRPSATGASGGWWSSACPGI